MIITDSQVHIWELTRPDRPWPPGRFVPEWASEALSAEALLTKMAEAGVDRAVLIPPAFEGDYNDLCLAAARAHPGRFGVMGRLPLDDPRSERLLPTWMANEGALGLRFTFFIPSQRRWLDDGTADWLWPAAEAAGIPLMVRSNPEALPIFGQIAVRHPDLKLIIDHLGVGHDAWNRDDRAFDHMDALLRISHHPNIAIKATGLAEYSTAPYPYRNVHKYFEKICGIFGEKRVFWGTDFTRLPCSYRQAVTMFTEEMPWLSSRNLELVMGGSLSEWLSWPAREVLLNHPDSPV